MAKGWVGGCNGGGDLARLMCVWRGNSQMMAKDDMSSCAHPCIRTHARTATLIEA